MSIISIFLAYILGSISSATLVAKMYGLNDPREHGSGNPGATNMLRIAGAGKASIVLFSDILKGLLAILIAKWLGMSEMTLSLVGISVVLGHLFPIFHNFQGGKGVATTIGVCFGLHWALGALVVLTWLTVLSLTRYSSLAGMIAILLAPSYSAALKLPEYFFPLTLISAFVILAHRENILRLIEGTESKSSLKTKPPSEE